jgi:hypothetical protein
MAWRCCGSCTAPRGSSSNRSLTLLALQQGFPGINTANQRHHYDEAAWPQAVSAMATLTTDRPLSAATPQ